MAESTPVLDVLAEFGLAVSRGACQDLGNAGGYSGAQFWRVSWGGLDYCLRCWPSDHPGLEHLKWIHQVLAYAARGGVDFIPVPRTSVHGSTIANYGARLWEVTPWIAGTADFSRRPTQARLAAALTYLGRFHQAVATFPPDGDSPIPEQLAPAPAVRDRIAAFQHWDSDAGQQLGHALNAAPSSELVNIAREILHRYGTIGEVARRQLEPWSRVSLRMAPCIRDIWHDHVLYVGDRVSGFVDFGAMRLDSVVTDVARLLGSMAGDRPELWQCGLQAFQQAFPLEEQERTLVAVLDSCNVALSGLNWLRWIFIEQRSFEDWQAIEIRLRSILRRMDTRADLARSSRGVVE